MKVQTESLPSVPEHHFPLGTVENTDEALPEDSGNEKSQEKQENAVTIEQVRAVMASKSQDGKTQQVKALIQKYGADKLSGVQPEKYADLLRDAKAL